MKIVERLVGIIAFSLGFSFLIFLMFAVVVLITAGVDLALTVLPHYVVGAGVGLVVVSVFVAVDAVFPIFGEHKKDGE